MALSYLVKKKEPTHLRRLISSHTNLIESPESIEFATFVSSPLPKFGSKLYNITNFLHHFLLLELKRED